MNRRIYALAATAAVLTGGAVATAAPTIAAPATPATDCATVTGNLIQNCGFEADIPEHWDVTPAASGSRFDVTYGNPHSGERAADFGASKDAPDTITQVVPTTKANTVYALSYWVANTDTDADATFTTSVEGTATLQTLSNAPASPYTKYSRQITTGAAGTPLRISFAGKNFDGIFSLDDVVLTEVGPAQVDTADVQVGVEAPHWVAPGAPTTTRLKVTNHGTATATAVTAGLIVPVGSTITDANGGAVGGYVVTFTVPALAAGQTRTYTIESTAPAGWGLGITAGYAVSATPDDNLFNNVRLALTVI